MADRVRRWGASRTASPGSTRCLGARPLSPEARHDSWGMSLGAHTWHSHAGKVYTMALIRISVSCVVSHWARSARRHSGSRKICSTPSLVLV